MTTFDALPPTRVTFHTRPFHSPPPSRLVTLIFFRSPIPG